MGQAAILTDISNPFSPIPDNNLIRFDRIYSGEEKRTSCILRNLPNRMTQLELMEVSI